MLLDLKICSAGVYRRPEKYFQQVTHWWIGLYVSGMIRHQVILPDGRLGDDFDGNTEPYLFLRCPGSKIDFEFGPDREDWVIMFDSENLSYQERKLQFHYDGEKIAVPLLQTLPPEEVPACRNTFEQIQYAWKEGLPRDLLYAAFLIGKLLSRFLMPPAEPKKKLSPADRLKRAIDDDIDCCCNLSQLSEQLGYSRDYLRLVFQQEFKLSPGEYRAMRRLHRIMELITDTELTPTEIADRVGLKHASHLNILLRRHYQLSPSELIRRTRFHSPG